MKKNKYFASITNISDTSYPLQEEGRKPQKQSAATTRIPRTTIEQM
jgi:hypothetical protein